MVQQQAKAAAFRLLHSGKEILLLPNVWDVASARIIEEAGFKAIATSSAGIAFSLGYPDGQIIPREEMLATIARITKAVRVPVTADVEAGYGNSPEDAGRTARAVLDVGAIGMNLEDAIANSTTARRIASSVGKDTCGSRDGEPSENSACAQRPNRCVPPADRRSGTALRRDSKSTERFSRRRSRLCFRARIAGCAHYRASGG